jgi:hypothetical protein
MSSSSFSVNDHVFHTAGFAATKSKKTYLKIGQQDTDRLPGSKVQVTKDTLVRNFLFFSRILVICKYHMHTRQWGNGNPQVQCLIDAAVTIRFHRTNILLTATMEPTSRSATNRVPLTSS